jgi:hypothetical protein
MDRDSGSDGELRLSDNGPCRNDDTGVGGDELLGNND